MYQVLSLLSRESLEMRLLYVCKTFSTLNYTCPQPETALTHLYECCEVKNGVASTCSSLVLHPLSLMRKGFWWHMHA